VAHLLVQSQAFPNDATFNLRQVIFRILAYMLLK